MLYPATLPTAAPPAPSRRHLLVAGGVLAAHVAALWALQTGLLRRPAELLVPARLVSELITPAQPQLSPAPPAPPTPRLAEPPPKPAVQPAPRPRPVPTPAPVAAAAPAPAPSQQPVAAPSPAPSPNAITARAESSAAAAPAPATAAAAPAAAAPPAPPAAPPAPVVQLPSSEADYLQNPKPAYPPASKRLGEQGRVVVRVLIGVDGSARQATLAQSSGYDRLDQAALQTVQAWRYVPGKRNGVAEAMWFNVPINFVLE